MKSRYPILEKFNNASSFYKDNKHLHLSGEQIILFFNQVKENADTYTAAMVEAQEGNVIALAAMGAYYYANNDKNQAFAMFEAAVEVASKNLYSDTVCNLAYAIATFVSESHIKTKYYHAAILAGNNPSFLKLAFCFADIGSSADYKFGTYYALFALNLMDDSRRSEYIRLQNFHPSWNAVVDEKQSFSLYQIFQQKEPAEFKKFFIQHPVAAIKKGIRDENGVYTDNLFKQYQEELVGDILKEALQLKPRGACFSDDIEKVLPRYQGKYHADYFANLDDLLKHKINQIEEKVAPVCLQNIENMTNYRIKELLNTMSKLLCVNQADRLVVNNNSLSPAEIEFYQQVLNAHSYLLVDRNKNEDSKRNDQLRTSFINQICGASLIRSLYKKQMSDIEHDKVKNVFLELQAHGKVREALRAPESNEDVLVFRSRPSALPESCVGPQGSEISYLTERKVENDRIAISKTKKFAHVVKTMHSASDRLKIISGQDSKKMEWNNLSTTTTAVSGVAIYMALGVLTMPEMACLIGASALVLGLVYLISNYNHPVAADIRNERNGARAALGFFENRLIQNNNVKPAYTLPTVRAHL